MTEQEAQRYFDFMQTVSYDSGDVDVYFDVSFEDGTPYMSDKSQVFYRGTDITDLIDWDKIDKAINWKRVEEEARERDE